MREIKFRYVLQHEETGRFVEKIYTLEDIEKKWIHIDAHYTLVARDQWTGRKDCAGSDVYEGDIVKGVWFFPKQVMHGPVLEEEQDPVDYKGVVKLDEEQLQYTVFDCEDDLGFPLPLFLALDEIQAADFTVIGNIHQHLLEN